MRLIQAAFRILDRHHKTDWFDSYVILFNECARLGLKDYSRKIFYNMLIEAIRSDESWFFEEFISEDGEALKLLKDLEVFELTKRVTQITKEKRELKDKRNIPKKYQYKVHMAYEKDLRLSHRKNAEKHLCVCCHDLCIRPEELVDIDSKDLDYVKGLFERAINEKRKDHRQYLCNRILWRIFEKAPLKEVLDMWLQAQRKGIWVDGLKSADLASRFESEITKEENFLKILKIVSYREKENDPFIGDVVGVLFKEGKFDKAFYLSGKISDAKERVFQVFSSIFEIEGKDEERVKFLERLDEAVNHEMF